MIKREKVIKGLESLHTRLLDVAMQDSIIMLDVSMVENAIDLLKEQEAVEPTPLANRRYACGNCGNSLWVSGQRFCASCGKAVKWDA